MAPPPPPPLPEEHVEEILVRFPPEDRASLVRAALVCRLWRRLVPGPVFRRAFHRAAAPVLGVICQTDPTDPDDDSPQTAHFIPTTTTMPFRLARSVHHGCRVVDARHGRVLLQRDPHRTIDTFSIELFVWNPITDEEHQLPRLPLPWHLDLDPWEWKAVVMCGRHCSSHGQHHHHRDCASSSFLVVFVKLDWNEMSSRVYESESGAWTEEQVASSTPYLAELQQQYGRYQLRSGVLVAGALQFMVDLISDVHSISVLRYNLRTQELCAIRLPLPRVIYYNHVLVAMEDGRLSVAAMEKNTLCLYWAPTATGYDATSSDNDAARFVLGRVIDLEKLLSANGLSTPDYPPCLTDFNSADATGVLFIRTSDGGLYSIDTKSGHVKRLPGYYKHWEHVVPYVSFHTPHISGGSQEQLDEAVRCGKRKTYKLAAIACGEARRGKRSKKPNVRFAGPEWEN